MLVIKGKTFPHCLVVMLADRTCEDTVCFFNENRFKKNNIKNSL